MTVIDLFAGPGGWDLSAEAMGISPIGLEFDDNACATRRAAGLRTMQCDVAAVDLTDPVVGWPGTRVHGLIASPPCQAFSTAGKGAGRGALGVYVEALQRMADGDPMPIEELDAACGDPRGHLVLEPMRWALALNPEWIALEQVPPVLPLWEIMAVSLRKLGYSVWTGILSAEQYGVPQTRKRAILIASRTRTVSQPPPTHQRYLPTRKNDAEGLFDMEPQRRVHPDDHGLLPWVSMADALGWGMTERPYPVIACSSGTGGPDKEKVGGSAARAVIYDEQAAGRWCFRATNERPRAAERELDEPAPSLAFGHNPPRWVLRAGTNANDASRHLDEPAPTMRFGARLNNVSWVEERPATTVACDPRIHPPGHKVSQADLDAGRNDYEGRAGTNAVRVTIEEAGVLQSFPADYPWQGTKTKRFQQVGNAIPVLLAGAILKALVD
ncbi:DNA cytosine methyltransferase [Paraconexibacter antarcticus]|uniref:DNA (cytosine-5-)-methyltransferase n=1 Tax=Paraconexibacter antarcticus TaxID=2949664 RepID=A0ABY5DXF7_9ACTN|nr:DNA cytosine methyltransferase [Paraconexibacter antarcticus]UTI65624.1 DNA cytosine methyltransferase [Paraconexibacter antarcticus]